MQHRLGAWSQVQLGILALARGRPEEARALLDEGLELSLATHSTRNVTLCLTAFAQMALGQAQGERAALLAGAAEGLKSARRWARTASTRTSPQASGSTAARQ